MKQAEQYLEKYQQAPTWEERRTVAEEYKTVYANLSADEQKQASAVMSVLWPSIEQRITELNPLMQRADRLLAGEEIIAPVAE